MSIGNLVTAARYNVIQSKAGNVLGNGTGQLGYGQILQSYQLNVSKQVDAADMNRLRTDLVRIHAHQTGTLPANLPLVQQLTDIADAEYVIYETVSDTVYTNRNLIDIATQSSVENKISSQRQSIWGGAGQVNTVVHEISVIFPGGFSVSNINGTTQTATGADHRRHFFNAGGEIRFSASIVNGSGSKTLDWASMFISMSTVRFGRNSTFASSGAGTSIGNFNLTDSFQTLFIKAGSSSYSDNAYTVKARGAQNSNEIIFRIEISDNNGSTNVSYDESVNGTLTSSVSQLRPTGSYVAVTTPLYQNLVQLA
jgi:hypothetical protein